MWGSLLSTPANCYCYKVVLFHKPQSLSLSLSLSLSSVLLWVLAWEAKQCLQQRNFCIRKAKATAAVSSRKKKTTSQPSISNYYLQYLPLFFFLSLYLSLSLFLSVSKSSSALKNFRDPTSFSFSTHNNDSLLDYSRFGKGDTPPSPLIETFYELCIYLYLYAPLLCFSLSKRIRSEELIVATTRRLASDSGAFVDWVASSSASAGDLSLGFNAGSTAAAAGGNNSGPSAAGMWSSAAATSRHINCGLPPEFFFVAPASSFHHHPEAAATAAATTINFDPHSLNASNAIGVGVGVNVIPLLTATPCLAQPGINAAVDEDLLNNTRNRGGGGMQLWQQHQQGQNNSSAYLIKPMTLEHSNLVGGSGGGGGGGGIGGSSSMGAATCQDCGNQAKKDCVHRRCRTCCKSRGYDCATHVKSTWVPAARRRERQLMASNAATAGSSQSTSGTKKPRLGGASQTTTASHTSTSNTTPQGSFDTSSSHQDVSFKESLPGQVRAPAVFKCVRVTAIDDGEDEYAYQAVVRIGGHVFKGFLYDQGIEGRDGLPNISELHLGGGSGSGSGGGNGGGGRNGGSSSPPVLDTSDHIYAASGGGLLGGSSYGV